MLIKLHLQNTLLRAFEKLKLEGLSEKTISNYKNALAKFLEFLEEKYNIQGLKQEIMQEINKYYKWKQPSLSNFKSY